MAVANQHFHSPCTSISIPQSPASRSAGYRTPALAFSGTTPLLKNLHKAASARKVTLLTAPTKASKGGDGIVPAVDDREDGVSLGTMKLSPNVDIPRFETLLFQWANSLCQGANLPLPVPLKVDKIQGGARLGFIAVDDGKTEMCVYIDCLVFPAAGISGPYFRAIRNGPLKDKAAPGEQRIMRSLLQALQKSADIARV